MSWSDNKKKRKKKQHKPGSALKPRQPASPALPNFNPAPWTPPFKNIPQTPKVQQIPEMPKKMDISELDLPLRPTPRRSEAKKEFMRTFHRLTGRYNAWDIWHDFVVMAACGISNALDKAHEEERAKRYLEISGKYTQTEMDIFVELFGHLIDALEEDPEQDFLGSVFTELGLNSKERRQIFTPYPVARLMSEISMSDIVEKVKEDGTFTILDCCCGTGGTLIASVNKAREELEKAGYNFQNHMMVMGQDIDETVALACYVQLSLLGVAGVFKVDDAIAKPMALDDNTSNYWFTPMYHFPVWEWRRVFRALDVLTGLERLKLEDGEEKKDHPK